MTAASLCVAGFEAQQRGDATRAIECFRRALALEPASLEVRMLLVYALGALGDRASARQMLRETPNIAVMSADDARRVADTATDLGADDAALQAVRRALHFAPNDADLHGTLGALLHRTGCDDEATAVLDAAATRWPKQVSVRMNRARLRADQGDFAGALHDYDAVVRIAPDHMMARKHRGIVRLTLGDYAGGWPDHEARRALPMHRVAEPTDLPAWDGSALHGRRILLWGEQGLGDQLMGLRFAAVLADRGATVVVRTHPSLLRMAQTAPGVSAAIATDTPHEGCELHVPMLSVPALLGLQAAHELRARAYLSAPPSAPAGAQPWQDRLPATKLGGRRVALVWAGSAAHGNDHNRSLPAHHLPELLAIPDVQWISVQLGDRTQDLHALPVPLRARVTDLSAHLADFGDTAEVLHQCDALVSVDTSVAHLGGALGVRTLIMVPFAPDWRWGLARRDSVWYDSVELLRQPAPQAWAPVIAEVHDALARLWS